MTVANAVMFVMFAFAVVVQVNDADPIAWMAIYAGATAVCALEVRRRARWWQAAAVGAIALVWAATLAPRVVGKVRFLSMFEEFEMRDIHVEEAREMYGLLLVTAWMAVVALAARRRLSAKEKTADPSRSLP